MDEISSQVEKFPKAYWHLRLQLASVPLQVPLAWHLLTAEPSISYPESQVNVTG